MRPALACAVPIPHTPSCPPRLPTHTRHNAGRSPLASPHSRARRQHTRSSQILAICSHAHVTFASRPRLPASHALPLRPNRALAFSRLRRLLSPAAACAFPRPQQPSAILTQTALRAEMARAMSLTITTYGPASRIGASASAAVASASLLVSTATASCDRTDDRSSPKNKQK